MELIGTLHIKYQIIGFIRYFKIINRGKNDLNEDDGNTELYIKKNDLYGNVVECDTNCTVLPHILLLSNRCKTRRINFLSLIVCIFIMS